jgi:hypothetical protein
MDQVQVANATTTRRFGTPPVSITTRQQQEAKMAFEQKDNSGQTTWRCSNDFEI